MGKLNCPPYSTGPYDDRFLQESPSSHRDPQESSRCRQTFPLPNEEAMASSYALTDAGEALLRCPTLQHGQSVTSRPVICGNNSTADNLDVGTVFCLVRVSRLHRFSFVALFLGLSSP